MLPLWVLSPQDRLPKTDIGRNRDDFRLILPIGATRPPRFLCSGRTSLPEQRDSSLCEHQVGKAEQREELRSVFGNTALARLTMPKEVFDGMEGMLAMRPNPGLGVPRIQWTQ